MRQQSNFAAAEAEKNWLDAAQTALTRNRTTFAVLSIRNVLSADGYLAKLREKGYTVEEPQ
jgi:hypothetical protein